MEKFIQKEKELNTVVILKELKIVLQTNSVKKKTR
jgi:hypothetical protein